MDISAYDVYALQLLQYLITKYEYQIVRVQQHKDDIWLMNPSQENYPVLRISSKKNACTLSDSEYIRNVHRIILNLIHREGPIMILNTNPECTPVDNALMTQIRVTTQGISDMRILTTFPGIDQVVHEVEDWKDTFSKLTKEIEEAQLKIQKKTIEKAKKAAQPKATQVLIGICIAWFVMTFVFSILANNAVVGVIASGGYYKMNVVAGYEFYRFLTAGFVHADIFQLAVNVYVFFQVGKLSERMFSKPYYVLMFLSSIVIGNLFVYVACENTISYGISAGVIGMITAYITCLVANGAWRLPTVKFAAMRILWYGVLILLITGVPFIGVLGGAITGLFLSIIASHEHRLIELKKHSKIAGGMLLIALGYFCSQVHVVQPVHKEVDEVLIEFYQHTPMDAYAQYLTKQFEKQYQKEDIR